MEPISWFYIFLGFLFIEITTINLVTLWFAIGALAAAAMSYWGMPVDEQITGFLVVSISLLIPFKPWVQKIFNDSRVKTNLESLIGKKAVVEETIDTVNDMGKVKLDGMQWSAKTKDLNIIIPEGSIVEVQAVEGVKLVVKVTE